MTSRVYLYVALAALVAPQVGQARNRGELYYLVSPDGKLVWKYRTDMRTRHLSCVDPETERVYEIRGKVLTATPFGQREPVWSVPSPVVEDGVFFAKLSWHTAPGLVALVTPEAVHAFDAKTGKLKYTFALDRYDALGNGDTLRPGVVAVSGWNPTSGAHRYLTDRTRPLGFAKFDMAEGRLVWERTLPAPGAGALKIGAVVPGVIRLERAGENRGEEYRFFCDATGDLLTQVSADPNRYGRVRFDGGIVYHLSTGAAPALTAFDCGTERALWSLPELEPDTRLLGDHRHGRLFLAGKDLMVVDTRKGRVGARVDVAVSASAAVVQSESRALLVDRGTVRLVTPTTGAVKWKLSNIDGAEGVDKAALPHPRALDQDRFVVVTAQPQNRATPDGRVSGSVSGRSLADGAEQWTFAVHNVGDGTSISSIVACRSGFLLQCDWHVLD